MSVGIAAIIVSIGVSLGGDDESDEPVAIATTTPSPSVPATTLGGAEANSEVPPVDCWDLLTDEEIFEALGGDENEELGSGSSGLRKDEICTLTRTANEDYFVQISPGGPSDFAADAQLVGVTGEEVSDVGDGALWFGGPDADDGGKYGVIVVQEDTQHGALYFRILIGRPDVDEATQRQRAAELANIALPRFPGVVVEQPEPAEPEVFIFDEEEPPDRSNLSLADNLLAKEERGEWTRGEGLVASLGFMAGEVDVSGVHSHPELFDQSATMVILLAREYLEAGDDESAKAEMERLLDRLTFSREELDQMSTAPSATGLLVSAIPMAQEEADDPCDNQYLGENPCFEQIPLPDRFGVPRDKYALFVQPFGPWTFEQIEVVRTAILDSAQKYEPLGKMPITTVILDAGGEVLYTDSGRSDCSVDIYQGLANADDDELRQIIAREMAFCLISGEFFSLASTDVDGTLWWVRGLANYLSGYVYASANVEHRKHPAKLAAIELSTTLDDRSWTNWIFFEYLHPIQGAEGNMAMISGFPVGGDHIAALAAYSDTPKLFHDFERALTDSNVPDQGPGTVPYEPRTWELPISAPIEAEFLIPPFGVRRIHITVPEDRYACFGTVETGQLMASWRPGTPGEPDSWVDFPPLSLGGDTMLVVTAVKPGAEFTLEVTEFSDDPDCEDEAEGSPPTTLGDCGFCDPSRFYHKP